MERRKRAATRKTKPDNPPPKRGSRGAKTFRTSNLVLKGELNRKPTEHFPHFHPIGMPLPRSRNPPPQAALFSNPPLLKSSFFTPPPTLVFKSPPATCRRKKFFFFPRKNFCAGAVEKTNSRRRGTRKTVFVLRDVENRQNSYVVAPDPQVFLFLSFYSFSELAYSMLLYSEPAGRKEETKAVGL